MDREDVLVLLDASLQPIFEEQFEQSARITSLGCCRFRGHRPKLFELSRTLSD